MSDYNELKRLAEHHLSLGHAYTVATPAAVLALIAENERLTGCIVHRRAQSEQYDQALIKMAAERDQLKAENETLRKRIDDMSPFKGAPFTGQDPKCLACGGYHYGMAGLPCPNMRVMAQVDLPETRSGQIGAAMGKGEQS